MKPTSTPVVAEPGHVVRFFDGDAELVEAVADFASAGLVLGDAVVLAVGRGRAARIRRELSARGYAGALPEAAFLDADALSRDLSGARASGARTFDRLIAAEVAAAQERAGSGRVRVYSELVDLLWNRGRQDEALVLENRWDALCMARPLRLLCGYRLSLTDRRCLGVCESHDAVAAVPEPSFETERALSAVHRILGSQADMLGSLVAAHRQLARLPFEQAALIWMGRHMPASASRLAKALER